MENLRPLPADAPNPTATQHSALEPLGSNAPNPISLSAPQPLNLPTPLTSSTIHSPLHHPSDAQRLAPITQHSTPTPSAIPSEPPSGHHSPLSTLFPPPSPSTRPVTPLTQIPEDLEPGSSSDLGAALSPSAPENAENSPLNNANGARHHGSELSSNSEEAATNLPGTVAEDPQPLSPSASQPLNGSARQPLNGAAHQLLNGSGSQPLNGSTPTDAQPSSPSTPSHKHKNASSSWITQAIRVKKQAKINVKAHRDIVSHGLMLPTASLVKQFTQSIHKAPVLDPLYKSLSRTESWGQGAGELSEEELEAEELEAEGLEDQPANHSEGGAEGVGAEGHKGEGVRGQGLGAEPKFEFGRLLFGQSRSMDDPSIYCKVPSVGKGGNAHLMRFIAERVWHLARPDLLISVTGGAQNFDLPLDRKDMLMHGLMSVADHMKTLFVTGGTSTGIMKYVGEAKARFGAEVPLVGILPYGVLKGRGHLQSQACMSEQDHDVVMYDKAAHAYDAEVRTRKEACGCKSQSGCAKCKVRPSVSLDHNHTHFFFVDNDDEGVFGSEIETRTSFEASIAGKDNFIQSICHLITGAPKWEKSKSRIMRSGIDLHEERWQSIRSGESDILSVCICVQGGLGSVDTVMSSAERSIPVFLVKGSGQAADLIADLVILVSKLENPKAQLQARDPPPFLKTICQKARKYMISVTHANLSSRKSSMVDPFSHVGGGSKGRRGSTHGNGLGTGAGPFPSTGSTTPRLPQEWNFQEKHFYSAAISGLGLLADELRKQQSLQTPKSQISDDYSTAGEEDQKDVIEAELITAIETGYTHYFGSNFDSTLTCVNIFHKAMKAVSTDLCFTYDLGYDEPDAIDFFEALLKCIINVMGSDEVALREKVPVPQVTEQILLPKMMIAIRWKRVHVLKQILETTKVPKNSPAFQDAANKALAQALYYNCTDAAKLLLDNRATLDQYCYSQVRETPTLLVDRQWQSLLDSCMTDMALHYLAVLFRKQEPGGSTRRLSFSASEKAKGSVTTRGKVEAVLNSLMGENFDYTMGMEGPELDLMLISVLMNRIDMAKLFWKRCGQPVLSALTVCILYRKIADRSDITPVLLKELLQAADEFENLATEVQTLALHLDIGTAMDSLEHPCLLWEGMRIVDVAVYGNCELFVESCCREVLDRRFAGDLMPHGQHIGPVTGLKRCSFILIFTGGLLAPFFLKYNPPPKASNIRFPTQRRKIPRGYPYETDANEVLKNLDESQLSATTKDLIERVREDATFMVENLTEDNLAELWAPTFTYREKLVLFWCSPAVLFNAGTLVHIAVLFIFTSWVVFHYDEADLQFEDFLFTVYFGSSLLMELCEMFLSGADYFNSFWNVLDLGSDVIFMSSLYMKNMCCKETCDTLIWVAGLTVRQYSKFGNSVCCAFLWMRFLRVFAVHKEVGPLVIMVRRMGSDLVKFGLVFAVMWMAFAIMMNGASQVSTENEECLEGDDGTNFRCTSWWWLFRTFFQAMGDPMIFDHRTNIAVYVLIALFTVMHVILLNLLIAIMSNTYQAVQIQSHRKFLMDFYGVAYDYSRIATAMPLPFNTIALLPEFFLFLRKHLNGTLDLIYPNASIFERLRKYLSINFTEIEERLEVARYRKKKGNLESASTVHWWRRRGRESYLQRKIGGFMETVKRMYIQRKKVEQEVSEVSDGLVTRSTNRHVKMSEKTLGKMTETQDHMLEQLAGISKELVKDTALLERVSSFDRRRSTHSLSAV